MLQRINEGQQLVLDPEKARLITRISQSYVLRALQLVAELHGGDFLRAIIATTIVAANVGHINNRRGGGERYETLQDPPPDSERRPVSVSAISKALGIPFETTRRHVNGLIASGYCVRVRGGVYVPTEVLVSEANETAIGANLKNLQQMLRELERVEALTAPARPPEAR